MPSNHVAAGSMHGGYIAQRIWWDGKRLAITVAQTDEGQYYNVYLLDADKSDIQAVVSTSPYLGSQTISPDGRYVLVNGKSLWLFYEQWRSGQHVRRPARHQCLGRRMVP